MILLIAFLRVVGITDVNSQSSLEDHFSLFLYWDTSVIEEGAYASIIFIYFVIS
jgi:hypothetical protein